MGVEQGSQAYHEYKSNLTIGKQLSLPDFIQNSELKKIELKLQILPKAYWRSNIINPNIANVCRITETFGMKHLESDAMTRFRESQN